MGTLRMGDDPATSVTDRDGRTHANPTLAIAAVTRRQAERLIAALSRG